jgi:hypothetical protein
MIAQELVKAGGAYVGKDGEVRHVYSIGRPGNGYCVLWDSKPRPADTKSSLEWFATRNERPNGYMPMRKFQKWAIEQVEAKAASHDTKGEKNV